MNSLKFIEFHIHWASSCTFTTIRGLNLFMRRFFISRVSTPAAVGVLMLIVFSGAALTGCRSGSAEVHYLDRGKELLAKKEYARAILEFKNATRLQPKDAEPYYQTG